MKTSNILGLFFLLVGVFTLSLLNIQEGHNWGGDFAMYIHQAISIVDKSMTNLFVTNKFTIDNSSSIIGPYLYPNGFPLLLTPIYYWFDVDFFLMKLLCTIFFLLSLLIIFLLSGDFFDSIWLRYIVIILIGYNWMFIEFTDNILSDFPFLFFTVLSIYLISKKRSFLNYCFLGVLIFYAYFTRDIGIVLLPTVLIFQLENGDTNFLKRKIQLLPYLIFFVLLLVSKIVFPTDGGANNFQIFDFSIKNVILNCGRYVKLITEYFMVISRMEILVFSPIIIGMIMLGIIKSWKKNLYIIFYVFGNLGILLLWPYWQGVRFIFPILPFLVIFFIKGFLSFFQYLNWERFNYKLLSTYLFIYLLLSMNCIYNVSLNRKTNQAFTEEMIDVYDYIFKHINQEEIIGFRKPRVLRLFTNKNAIFIHPEEFELSVADYLLVKHTKENLSIIEQFEVKETFLNYTLIKKVKLE